MSQFRETANIVSYDDHMIVPHDDIHVFSNDNRPKVIASIAGIAPGDDWYLSVPVNQGWEQSFTNEDGTSFTFKKNNNELSIVVEDGKIDRMRIETDVTS